MQDNSITKYEARFKEAQAEAQELAAEVAQERRRADAAEARVSELLEQRARARRSQERQAAEFGSLQAALRAEASAAKVWVLQHAVAAVTVSSLPKLASTGARLIPNTILPHDAPE